MAELSDLPVELIQRIASFTATCESILNLSRVSRSLQNACIDNAVFKDWFKYHRNAIYEFALGYDPPDRSVWRRFALAEAEADKALCGANWTPQLLALHRMLHFILSLFNNVSEKC
jgi:hypothetical protein